MDGNFNIQQNNIQQPTGGVMNQQMQQPMMNQQMQQPMMNQQMQQPMMSNQMAGKKKSKKGLFIGLSVALILIIIGIAVSTDLAHGERSLEGTWVGKDGTEVSFIDDGRKDGYLRFDIILDGEETTANVTKYGKILKFITEEWNDEVAAYDYDFKDAKIKKLTNSKLVIEYEGEKYTFKRK